MEKILQEQANLALEIQRLYNKVLGAGVEDAVEVLQKTQRQLEVYMAAFVTNHTRLESEDGPHKKDKYFENQTLEKVQMLQDTATARLEQLLKESKVKPTVSGKSEIFKNDDEIKIDVGNLTKARSGTHRKFQFAVTDFELVINEIREGGNDFTELEKVKNKAQDLFYEYIEQFPDDELVDMFYVLRDEFIVLKKNKTPQVENSYNLPSIEIPMFDGDYSKWETFKELFEHMVMNRNISEIQKMCILKSKVKGDAAKCIANMPITSTSLKSAWEILNKEFSNNRLIVNSYIKKLVDAPMVIESPESVKMFERTIKESLQAIQSLKLSAEEIVNATLTYILLGKLNEDLRFKFELSLSNSKEIPQVLSISKFLEQEYLALENAKCSGDIKEIIKKAELAVPQRKINRCIMECKINHGLYQCPKFRALDTNDRWAKVMVLKLCSKCLKSGHISKQCNAIQCRICKGNHNSLLHNVSGSKKETQSASVQRDKQGEENCVLLATAIIKVKNSSGKYVQARAMLDSGSQVNLITKSMKDRLRVTGTKSNEILMGIGANVEKTNEKINVEVQSNCSEFTTHINMLVVPKILSDLPSQKIVRESVPHNLKLADPQFELPRRIDILIGAEMFYEILKPGQYQESKKNYKLHNTVFGWVASGLAKIEGNTGICAGLTKEEEKLDQQLEKFGSIENVNIEKKRLTDAEIDCENQFYKSLNRQKDGRFVVGLPVKSIVENLGSSAMQARRRFQSLERKLGKDESLKKQYSNFINEYLSLGHMEEVQVVENEQSYYLPHHCIIRPESTTTKLRVVFDGSCKTTTNLSLNDVMHTGPKLQENLFNILLRFRKHKYVFTADIEKMYRQIWVAKEWQKFQLIFWRENPKEKLKTFALKTVTYGTACAPYLATKCLMEIAEEQKQKFPIASNVIRSDFYMDDLMTGSDDLKEVKKLQEQIDGIMRSYGCHLRKWCSNDESILKHISKTEKEENLKINFDQTEKIKTLGVCWYPKLDNFQFQCNWETVKEKMTKRKLLSDISKLFDPLGLVNPVVVRAKIMIQDIWKLKMDWDQEVPNEIQIKWVKMREDLPNLNKIRVDRRIICNNPVKTEIHGFCDASMKAYGAVIYLKSVDVNNETHVKILAAKSRVAPVKILTLPRLELCAAGLLVELTKTVLESLKMKIHKIWYYSDSEIVLSWLKLDPALLQVFVSNRVNYIQQNANIERFCHVATKENPADLISRGVYASELIENELWFQGPQFLRDVGYNPAKFEGSRIKEVPEIKKIKLSAGIIVDKSWIEKIETRNNFDFFTNVIANVLKIKEKLLKRHQKEILQYQNDALTVILTIIQDKHFDEEKKDLLKVGKVSNKSKLVTLCPVLDDKGLIRVGGRIDASKLPYDARHPVVLPYDDKWVTMLVEKLHVKHLHVGPQGLLAIIRQKYWPLRGKQLTAKVVKNCYRCFRVNPRPLHQIMGSLPEDRLVGTRPFRITGIDFLGPVKIHHNIRGRKTEKAYVCVFVCFAIKAVHIEVVTDLSSAAFIGALSRFVARRSCPEKIYSDNATNFVGSNNALKEVHELFQLESHLQAIDKFCVQKLIEWVFIPAKSPHVGGLWEAAVRSVKKHFWRAVEGNLTYEQLNTVMTLIEAVLNSRPLTQLSTDPHDYQVLTPGHFLVGRPLETIVNSSENPVYHGLQHSWRIVEENYKGFWRRWSLEYLSEMQKRYKWRSPSDNIKKDTLVLLKEDNVSPLNWRRGRVTDIIVGSDKKCRMVEIRTATGTTKRAVQNICPFPLEENNVNEMNKNEQYKFNTHSEKKIRWPRRSSRIKQKNVIASLLLYLLVLPLVKCLEITTIKDKSGIFFENQGKVGIVRSSWELVLHADMTEYWRTYRTINASFHEIVSMRKSLDNDSLVAAAADQLGMKMERLNRKNEFMMYRQHTKRQRLPRSPLAFMGSMMHALFGLMDEEHAEILIDRIQKSSKNDEYLLQLLKEQISVQNVTESVLTAQNKAIWRNFEIIKQSMYSLSVAFNGHLNTDIFLGALEGCNLAMDSFTAIQEGIIELMWNSKGNFIEKLFPLGDFQQQIRTMVMNLDDGLKLPNTDPIVIGQLSRITCRSTTEQLLFHVKIPLIGREVMDLVKMVPYPIQHEGVMASVHSRLDYLIIDDPRTFYYGISEVQLYQCQKAEDWFICPHIGPMFSVVASTLCEVKLFTESKMTQDCEVQISPLRSFWRQLQVSNVWLFSVIENTTIHVKCRNFTTDKMISNQGTVRLEEGCRLINKDVVLWSIESYISEDQIHWPEINLADHLPRINPLKLNAELEVFKIPKIPKRRGLLELPSEWDLDIHEIFHYGMNGTTMVIMIAGVIIGVVVLKRLCLTTTRLMPVGGFNFGK